MLADVLDEEGKAVAAALREKGADAAYLHLDVTSREDWRHAIESVRSRYGGLNILVNNAGVAQPSGLLETSLDEWEAVLRINLTGAFLGIQEAAPAMPSGGSIVNISSIAGMLGYRTPAYAASKWGVRGLSHCAAINLVDRGIRVNSIHPGLIDTPMLANRTLFVETLKELTPMQRAGTADEVAKLVLFFASDEASFITGAEITIDGGFVSGAAIKHLMRTLDAAGT